MAAGNYGKLDFFTITFARPTGVENELGSGATVSVYPNPSTGEIHLSGIPSLQPFTLQVTDLAGKVVDSRETRMLGTDQDLKLDLSHLPKGMYVLKAEGEDFLVTEKITLQ